MTKPSDATDFLPAEGDPASADLFAGGGEAGALMRARDWSATPLGPPEGWPQPLRTLVGVMLGSSQAMFTAWGPARVMLYNDGYAPLCGARHPWALGRPFDEVWSDILDDVGPIMDRAYAGEPTHMDDIRLLMHRHGYPEEAHFAFSYTPVRDEAGRVAGMFCACVETTGRVLAERRVGAERDRLAQLFEQAPGFMAMLRGPEHRIELTNPAYMRLVGHRNVLGRTVAEALPDAAAQGYVDLLDQVYRSGEAFGSTGARYAVQATPGGPIDERFVDFIYQPVADSAGDVVGIFVEGYDVTERARAEAALRESEARLSAIFAQASAGIALTDLEGRFTLVNDRYLEIVGRTREELTSGLRMQDLTHPDDLPANLLGFRALASGGPAFDIEKRYLRPDGSAVWVRNSVGGVRGPGGAVEAVLAVSVDITGRKAAEAALAESEARFRNLADNAPVMVWVTEPDGTCSYLSRSWYEFTGQTEATGLGLGWLDATHPDDRAAAERAFLAANAAREPFRLEYRLRRADGAYRWALDAAAPRFGAGGAFLGYAGSVIDITERKAAEEVLEARVEERTAERDRLWALSEDLLVQADHEGRLLRASPSWTRLLGHDEAALLAAGYAGLVHPDDLGPVTASLAATRASGRPVRFEGRVRAADGSWRRIAWTVAPDPGGDRLYGVGRDVTAEREGAEALRQAEEQLRQAQKLEAVGRLTGGIAHDFNNLLQVVRSGLRLLERPGTEPALRQRLADEMRASVERGARLTRQLLAFSRRQALEPGPVDLAARVEAMRGLLDGSVPAGVRVEPELTPGLWPVEADPGELELALLNLVVNARDAMPEGGRIAIRAANALGLDGGGLRGDFVRVEVADEGTGMAPEVLARAFEPFFTTKGPGEGTGLGLAQVYGFARQSGGAALIESAPGRGATVALLLPRSRPVPP